MDPTGGLATGTVVALQRAWGVRWCGRSPVCVLVVVSTALAVLLAAPPAAAGADPVRKCEVDKLIATGKAAKAHSTCYAKGFAGAEFADCQLKADAQLTTAFTKADARAAKKGAACRIVGDAALAGGLVSDFATRISDAVAAPEFQCSARKLKAAGKAAASHLKANALRAKKPSSPKFRKSVLSGLEKLFSATRKADHKWDCPGDAALLSGHVEELVGSTLVLLGRCRLLDESELEILGRGRWGDLLAHATTIGYSSLAYAVACGDAAESPNQMDAEFHDPLGTPPTNRILLSWDEPESILTLVGVDADDAVAIFSMPGGVRILPDGSVEAVGPDGSSESGAGRPTTHAPPIPCDAFWVSYLVCRTRDVLLNAECELAQLLPICRLPANKVLCSKLAQSCGVAAKQLKEECSVLDPTGEECEPLSGKECVAVALCEKGNCVPTVPTNERGECSNDPPRYPDCSTFTSLDVERCTAGSCRVSRGEPCAATAVCPGNQRCSGAAGQSRCGCCGDGVPDTGVEACDSGGVNSASCDYDCTRPNCPDGLLNTEADEACDTGEFADGSDCAAVGMFGVGPLVCTATCGIDTGNCHLCGDGDRDHGYPSPYFEQCDINDFTSASGHENTCESEGFDGGIIVCNPDCTLDVSECSDCGNLIVETGEECDEGGGESATCDSDCTLPACGDGTPNSTAGEACDDGGESATCDSDCTLAVCGDGTTNSTAGEECDDSGVQTATCETTCTIPICGDDIVNPSVGETCDDGNTETDDGCDAGCVRECGNGIVDGSEECEPSADTCSTRCVPVGAGNDCTCADTYTFRLAGALYADHTATQLTDMCRLFNGDTYRVADANDAAEFAADGYTGLDWGPGLARGLTYWVTWDGAFTAPSGAPFFGIQVPDFTPEQQAVWQHYGRFPWRFFDLFSGSIYPSGQPLGPFPPLCVERISPQ